MSNFIATTTTATTIIGRSVPILWMDQVENANLITSFFFFVCLFAAVLLVLVLVKQTIVNCYIPQYLSYLSTSVVNNHNNNHNNHSSKYLLTNLPVLSSLAAAAASTLTPHTTSTTTNTTPTTTIATPTTPLLLSTNAITTFATTSVKNDADADEDADDTDDTNNTLSTPPTSSLSSPPTTPTTPTTIASTTASHHHQQQQQSTSLFNYSAATAVLSQFTSSTMSSICLIHAITSMVEYLCIFLTNELDLQLVVGGFKIYYGVIHFIYYACEMSVAYWIVFHVFRNRFMLNGMIQQYFSLSTSSSSSQQHAAANSHSSSSSSSSSSSNNSNISSNSVSSSVSSSSSSSSRSNAATVINKRHNSSSLHDAEYDVMMSSSPLLSSSPTPPPTPLLLSSPTTTSNDEKNHHHQRTQSSSSPWKNNQQQQQQQQENTFQQQYLQPLELKRLNRIRYLFCSCVIIGSVLSRSFIYIMWSEDDVSLLMHEGASYKLGSVRSWVFLLFSGLPSAFSLYYSAQILYRLMQSISDILSSRSSSGSSSSSGSNSGSSMINNGSINVSSSGSISINIGGGHSSESKRRNVSTYAVVRFCNRLRHLWKVVCASFYFVLMQEFCLVSVRQETAASPSSAGGHSRKNIIVDVTDDTARGSIITPSFNSTERTLATSAASILKSTFIYFILSIILQCKNVVEFVAVWTINFRSQSNAIGTVMNYGPILSRGILCCLFISFSMLYFLPFNRTRGRKVKSATATSYLILSHFSQSNKPRQKYLPF